jgi:hypothetical protein
MVLLIGVWIGLTMAHRSCLPPNAAPTAPRASASEVFCLRSECAALGQKIVDEDVVGVALTVTAASHYNPGTNRC